MAIFRVIFRFSGYFNLWRLSPKNSLKRFLGFPTWVTMRRHWTTINVRPLRRAPKSCLWSLSSLGSGSIFPPCPSFPLFSWLKRQGMPKSARKRPFVYVFFRVIPYRGEKYINKILPKIPGQSREKFVNQFFLYVFYLFAPIRRFLVFILYVQMDAAGLGNRLLKRHVCRTKLPPKNF